MSVEEKWSLFVFLASVQHLSQLIGIFVIYFPSSANRVRQCNEPDRNKEEKQQKSALDAVTPDTTSCVLTRYEQAISYTRNSVWQNAICSGTESAAVQACFLILSSSCRKLWWWLLFNRKWTSLHFLVNIREYAWNFIFLNYHEEKLCYECTICSVLIFKLDPAIDTTQPSYLLVNVTR